jgi:REP element-mobilizing transposase RayT
LEQWYELKNRYQNILLDQFVVMPNHIHGIIIIDNEQTDMESERVEQRSTTIDNIICAYKSITTKLLNKYDNLPGRIIWQRNYYDHIIHDENELQRIRQYITDNLAKWHEDEYFA